MTWHDGEQLVQNRKAHTQDSAHNYLITHSVAEHPMRRPVRLRVMASIGAAMVTVGYRLQSRYEQVAASALEPAEGLRFSSNGSGPGRS